MATTRMASENMGVPEGFVADILFGALRDSGQYMARDL